MFMLLQFILTIRNTFELYLYFFRWPNYIITLPRYFSFRLPSLNIHTGPLRRIGQEYSANVAWSTFSIAKRNIPTGLFGLSKTGSGCIRFNDIKVDQATFAEYSCPIRLRGPVCIFKRVRFALDFSYAFGIL
jgi:hypothetical protein